MTHSKRILFLIYALLIVFSLPIAKSQLATNVKAEIEKEQKTHPDQKSDK